MRGSILLWSTFSGVLLGLLADALLVGVWLMLSTLVQSWTPRTGGRLYVAIAVVVLTAVPVIGGVLGFLEGRLKLR